MAKILWMDNDKVFLWPHVARLEDAKHYVKRAYSVSEAEKLLKEEKGWDLVIIDPMMNVSEEEEKDYLPSETDGGLKAGVVFFIKNKQVMKDMGVRAVVFTMREDQEIIEDFMKCGMLKEAIKNKMDASDTADFLDWIEETVGEEGKKCMVK